jgi:hypothetical protein
MILTISLKKTGRIQKCRGNPCGCPSPANHAQGNNAQGNNAQGNNAQGNNAQGNRKGCPYKKQRESAVRRFVF